MPQPLRRVCVHVVHVNILTYTIFTPILGRFNVGTLDTIAKVKLSKMRLVKTKFSIQIECVIYICFKILYSYNCPIV